MHTLPRSTREQSEEDEALKRAQQERADITALQELVVEWNASAPLGSWVLFRQALDDDIKMGRTNTVARVINYPPNLACVSVSYGSLTFSVPLDRCVHVPNIQEILTAIWEDADA